MYKVCTLCEKTKRRKILPTLYLFVYEVKCLWKNVQESNKTDCLWEGKWMAEKKVERETCSFNCKLCDSVTCSKIKTMVCIQKVRHYIYLEKTYKKGKKESQFSFLLVIQP